MFFNYLKVAWRNVMKGKIFSLINITGLSVGLTCCMLITLYILNEISYDSYHKKADRLYQLGTEFVGLDNFKKIANSSAATGELMQREFPEIEQTTRLVRLFEEDKTLLQYTEKNGTVKSFYETKGFLADSTFFRMFTYHFIEGDPETALTHPHTIVISEEMAHKYFGSEPAYNKVLHISSNTNGDGDFLVTGVFRPIHKPSHIDGRFFISMFGGVMEQRIKKQGTDIATNNFFFVYFLLKPGADAKLLEAKFPTFLDRYATKYLTAAGFQKKQFLVPLKKIHLNEDVRSNISPGGSKTYLYILASIAVFTLLIACINFMNLATARSSRRSSEVGVRKVLGAGKTSLITQFLSESVLMSLVAFIFAIAFTEILLPVFNSLAAKNLSLILPDDISVFIAFLVLSVIAGLLAGSYPAFYLSSFNPAKVLKGKFSNSLAAVFLRRGLVIFQFVISVILIIASVVIAQQMQYLRSTDLGFDKDRQVVIPLRSKTARKMYESYQNELLKQSQIANAGASWYYPGIANLSDNVYYREGHSVQEGKDLKINFVDTRFLQTLNVKLLAGHLFSKDFPTDSSRIVLNEKAMKELGFHSAQDAIGKKLSYGYRDSIYHVEVAGVVKDFHFEDLHWPITPHGFQINRPADYNYMLVHTKPGNINAVLQIMQATWHNFNPTEPFEYSFLDADFQKNYNAENRLALIVGYFTGIAILISCLGLFGLATFSAEQRRKEIGVRKVLGASVAGIVTLLSKDFLKLVIVAIMIASPVAWWAMNHWLLNFAYHIQISWIVFLITTCTALFISLFTISFQAIRAAVANPVKSLRTE